jgi:hypothetical protein
MPAEKTLLHVIRYDAYAIYPGEGGIFIAEPAGDRDDDFQVFSRDLQELLRALDAIENAANAMQAVKPDWLSHHLAAPHDPVILPSAAASPDEPMVANMMVTFSAKSAKARTKRVIKLRGEVDPRVIDAMMGEGRLWELMTTEIERRFPLPDGVR